jgi:dihydroorotase
MNILIKQATVVNTQSPHHGKTVDILVERGVITQIKKNIVPEKGIKTIEEEGLYVSAGWLDMQANFCDPGYEHKETLENGLKTAAKGGFTGVCVMSGTNPPLHNKAQIDYVVNRGKGNLTDVFPVGTISYNQEGKDLSEMYDMQLAGAVAFSDYKKPIKDAGLVLRALQYSQNINSFIITHADDKTISQGGQMNEGVVSTKLGLKGIPALAEELMIQRNIQILEYTGGRIHFPTISTKGSVDLIKKAKANGLRVTCGVAAHQLLLDETELEGFDTHYKLNPPLRAKEDVNALRRALENGTIDVVVSDHYPQDIESKDLEFDLADNGIVALQTAFNCLVTGMPKIAAEKVGECLAENPRAVLGLKPVLIKEDEEANLTLFTLTGKTTLSEKQIVSRSKNTPFIGESLQGKVIGAINNDKLVLN